MKTFIIIFMLLFFQAFWDGKIYAQKQLIDTSSYGKFPCLANPVISGDGKYLAYDIRRGSVYGTLIKRIIQSTVDNWEIEVPIGNGVKIFTPDSKFCLFTTIKDSLYIIDLKRKSIKYIPEVSDFSISDEVTGEWLVYQLIGQKTKVFTVNLKTGNKQFFSNVSNYKLSSDGQTILMIKKSKKDTLDNYFIEQINLVNGKKQEAELGINIQNLVVDFKHFQFAFRKGSSIWYYKLGMNEPACLIGDISQKIIDSLILSNIGSFSQDGSRLFIELKGIKENKIRPEMRNVEIWSYTDAKLKSQLEYEGNKGQIYRAMIWLDDRKVIPLQKYANESLMAAKEGSDLLYLSKQSAGNGSFYEFNWNSKSQNIYTFVDGRTGKRELLDWLSDKNLIDPFLSPSGKYVVFYNKTLKSYCSYELKSKEIHDITKGIQTSWAFEGVTDSSNLRGVAGWLSDDKAILVYDSHDIWSLDPSGQNAAVNLTNGYGFKHHIVFDRAFNFSENWVIKDDNKILYLSAFNVETKDNGFFSMFLEKAGDPEQLTMGPYIYTTNGRDMLNREIFEPLKVMKSGLYIAQRMSSNDAPNYFSTRDFITFKRLTNIQPQKSYNWYTTKLHFWKSLDGRSLQGILYKPDNFDPKKKYPVIFVCYERVSNGLNGYLIPNYSEGRIDIPSYVSNGYLVFCPDIYYKVGDPMQGTYDAVVSAGEYISRLPFVDSKKIGLQGHSFGAIQTNYLVTHTNLFAAACSASGLGDWISAYGGLWRDEGVSNQFIFETGQNRIGSALWGNLTGYLKSSPVLYVDKITTPLLLMHTKLDGLCLYSNIMEFFLGLRRLGKKTWMLVYPNANHCVEGEDAKDYTLRMQQFFDHYLKDKPAPLWMLDDVNHQSIKSGLELDRTGRTPGPGLLIPEQQKIVDSLMRRKLITITLQ